MNRTLFLLAALSICSVRLQAQALSVSVRDSSGAPVSQVSVGLVDRTGRVVVTAKTGASGVAQLPGADSGRFKVIARRFGFRPAQAEVERQRGDTTTLRLTMMRQYAALDQVLVVAQRDSVRQHSTIFGIDLRATGGQIVTPAEVDQAILGARDIADVLQRRALSGVAIDQRLRCPRSSRAVGGCLPFVVDGQLYPNGTAISDVVVPEMIDYMVMLRGSEVGVRYGSVGQNGILLIATRRDWRRIGR